MRKSIFVLSILGTVAGTVHAQSTMTLYGILDEGAVSSRSATARLMFR
jgi:hypothetical protein